MSRYGSIDIWASSMPTYAVRSDLCRSVDSIDVCSFRCHDMCNFDEYVCGSIYMGYWSSVRSRWLDIGQVLFFFACLWTETELRSIKSQKKERGQCPAILTEQAWSIKDLLYGFRGNFSCRRQRVVLSGQDRSILPAWVVNHSAGFDSSCPLTELAI